MAPARAEALRVNPRPPQFGGPDGAAQTRGPWEGAGEEGAVKQVTGGVPRLGGGMGRCDRGLCLPAGKDNAWLAAERVVGRASTLLAGGVSPAPRVVVLNRSRFGGESVLGPLLLGCVSSPL